MAVLRHLMTARCGPLLIFVLLALGTNALVPAGTMIVPAGERGAAITLCPETHPLARALRTSAAPDLAALHAGMGHGISQQDRDDGHGVLAGHGTADHAAMGHAPQTEAVSAHQPDPDSPASSAPAPSQGCAFAGLGLAGLVSERSEVPSPPVPPLPEPQALLTRLQLVAPAHLRPPLRAPPGIV